MPRVRRVLVPVDFSAGSESAFEYAVQLAAPLGASIDVLHVVEPPRYAAAIVPVEGGGVVPLPTYARNVAAREMEDFLAAHKPRTPVALHGRLDFGDPATVIAEVARRERYDLVVMGTHGRTGLAHLLVGSVAEKVVRRASCPVLTVRVPDAAGSGEGALA